MPFVLIAWCVVLCASRATAQFLPHALIAREIFSSNSTNCNATCASYQKLNANCNTPHCGCNLTFMQTQGECLLCQTSTPQDAAAVEFLLDAESSQCHKHGFNVHVQLVLPPAAAAIVQKFDHDSSILRREQMAFLALQISGGHVGLVIVLVAALFSRQVHREPPFLNFCITWIFSSIVYSLLLYRGTDGNNAVNSLGFVAPNHCLAQAALVNGAQVMTACSTLGLVVQLWLDLRTAVYHPASYGPKWLKYWLLLSPYLLFIVFAVPSVFVGTTHVDNRGDSFERAIPTNFYCTLVDINPFLQAIYGVTLVLLLITLAFDAHITYILFNHWRAFRRVEARSPVSLSILLRVLAFSLYRVVVAVAYVSVIGRPPTPFSAGQNESLTIIFSIPIWVDMLQAAIPMVAFLVLGINKDVIGTLMFWRNFNYRALKGGVATGNETLSMIDTPVFVRGEPWREKMMTEEDAKLVSITV